MRGFYRGVSVSVPGLFLYNTLLFTSYQWACSKSSEHQTTQLSIFNIGLAGVSDSQLNWATTTSEMFSKEILFIVQMFAGFLTNTFHSPLGSFCFLKSYVDRLTRLAVELVRCRLQAQHNNCRAKSWSEIRHSVSVLVRHGGLRSLYRVL